MSTLYLKTDEHLLSRSSQPILSTGSVNVDKISVDFDSTWSGYAKTAVFYHKKGNYKYGVFSTDNTVTIPASVLEETGELNIGIFGTKTDSQITTSIIKYIIKEGTFTEIGSVEPEPDPDVYSQLMNNYAYVIRNLNYFNSEVDKKTEIDNEIISDAKTYSSEKIENLISNMNYKKVALKQTLTAGTNGAPVYISQIANILFIDIVGMLNTGTVSNQPLFTYSTDIPAVLYNVSQEINGATFSADAGSRTVKLSGTAKTYTGTLIFLVESSDDYSDETIAAIQNSITELDSEVDDLNYIPANYERKNLLKNTVVSQTKNGVVFTVNNDGTISANGTTTGKTFIDYGTLILNDGEEYILSGTPENGGSTFGVIIDRIKNDTIVNSVIDRGKGTSFVANSILYDSYNVQIRILPNVTLKNVIFKPMVRMAKFNNNYYEQYVDDMKKRISALESRSSNDINMINKIPFDYYNVNINKQIIEDSGINNNLSYKINNGKVKINAGTVSSDVNFSLKIADTQFIESGTYTAYFFLEKPDVNFYGQIRKVSDSGNVLGTYANGITFNSSKKTVSLTIPEAGYYEIYILNYTAGYVLSKDLIVEFMMTIGSDSSLEYTPNVHDANTRILALEEKINQLTNAILTSNTSI